MSTFSQRTRELLAGEHRSKMEALLSTLLPRGSRPQVTAIGHQWTPKRVQAILDELCQLIPKAPVSAEDARKRNFLGGVSKREADAFIFRMRRLEEAMVGLDEGVKGLKGPGPRALPSDLRLLSMELVVHLFAQGQRASVALRNPEVEAALLAQAKQMEDDFTANLAVISAAASRLSEPLGLLRKAERSARGRGRPENRAQRVAAVGIMAMLERLGVPSKLHVKLLDVILTASFEPRPAVDDLAQWAKAFLRARPISEKPSQGV